ncbi:dihydroflavonol-4-reductase [Cognatiyoonia koreensis]|uniref:Dihydroflavonol-4-reductase n=1 Tax=Cognatiyoonia koreensis TaxID=364200 RepID=A0A1I0RY42_9RHOB|nr:NAD-dependent epimerase/dehydratase family protein [Cognatiyoonia koreensis]SEW46391.1 dihydroflavonol-4-reductase [Cognatiyoonia koreensis]
MKTILLTGITGFIAKRIAVDLLNAGYFVRGSMRSTKRVQEVNAAVAPHLDDPGLLTRLSFCELDLMKDKGWSDAVRGVDAVLHTASPFPGGVPKNEDDVVRPAVDGVLRALRAAQAAGVTRFVMTSSVVAIQHKDVAPGEELTPDDWSKVGHKSMGPYAKSKTLAEQAAWDFVKDHPEMQLTAINPGLVVGTPMDGNYGTSLSLIGQFLTGKLPLVPNFPLAIVDIADVSRAHVNALTAPGSVGKRFILADRYMMAPDVVEILRTKYADRNLPKRTAPKFMVWLMSLFDAQAKQILPIVDMNLSADNQATTDVLGITFTPASEAILAAADAVVRYEDV